MELLGSFLVAIILFVVFIMPFGIIASSIAKASYRIANDDRENYAHIRLT
jgi:hypothetical protein